MIQAGDLFLGASGQGEEGEAMDSHSWETKAKAVECTGCALSAIEEAQGQLAEAVEYLSKVQGMTFERQRLSRLRKQLGRALYLVDIRRARLRREGALDLLQARDGCLEDGASR